MDSRWARITATSAAVAAGIILVLVGLASPAQAHDYLVGSNPEANSTITELPASFSITTNEALADLSGNGSGFGLQVKDAAGLSYTDGCLSIAGPTMSTGATLGVAGTYTVIWQVVSGDGHPASDEFTFTWQPSADFPPATGSATPPLCGEAVEPTPEATSPEAASPGATAEPSPASTAIPVAVGGATTAQPSPALWIAVVAALVAAGVTLVLVRRRRRR